MRHVSHAIPLALLGAMLAGTGGTATAQAPDSVAPIDQDAMAALNKMGAYLRTLNAFEVRAAVTTEAVLVDGEKIQSASTAKLIAERPARLRLETTSDQQDRLFMYDGKLFTLFAPRSNLYATVPAPPTFAQLADDLEDHYGIDLPFVDLFRWGTPESDADQITSATDVGPSQIDGTTCEQYAFRQDGLDWQVWIQSGDYPLPRKLVLTTLTDDARPQHTSLYTWNLAPSVDSSAFTFAPPADAKRITIADIRASRAASKP